MAQINAARDQANIEANKELAFRPKELELQVQVKVSTDATCTSNLRPPNRDAKSPKLPAFVEEKNELDIYLHRYRFERYAENAKLEENT